MKIDLVEVRRIAALACLDLDDAEVSRRAVQLSAILTHMEVLGRLETDSIEPTFRSVSHETPLREDVARPGMGAEEATRGAPSFPGHPTGSQFLVPRVIG